MLNPFNCFIYLLRRREGYALVPQVDNSDIDESELDLTRHGNVVYSPLLSSEQIAAREESEASAVFNPLRSSTGGNNDSPLISGRDSLPYVIELLTALPDNQDQVLRSRLEQIIVGHNAAREVVEMMFPLVRNNHLYNKFLRQLSQERFSNEFISSIQQELSSRSNIAENSALDRQRVDLSLTTIVARRNKEREILPTRSNDQIIDFSAIKVNWQKIGNIEIGSFLLDIAGIGKVLFLGTKSGSQAIIANNMVNCLKIASGEAESLQQIIENVPGLKGVNLAAADNMLADSKSADARIAEKILSNYFAPEQNSSILADKDWQNLIELLQTNPLLIKDAPSQSEPTEAGSVTSSLEWNSSRRIEAQAENISLNKEEFSEDKRRKTQKQLAEEAVAYIKRRDMLAADKNVIAKAHESDPEYADDFESEEVEQKTTPDLKKDKLSDRQVFQAPKNHKLKKKPLSGGRGVSHKFADIATSNNKNSKKSEPNPAETDPFARMSIEELIMDPPARKGEFSQGQENIIDLLSKYLVNVFDQQQEVEINLQDILTLSSRNDLDDLFRVAAERLSYENASQDLTILKIIIRKDYLAEEQELTQLYEEIVEKSLEVKSQQDQRDILKSGGKGWFSRKNSNQAEIDKIEENISDIEKQILPLNDKKTKVEEKVSNREKSVTLQLAKELEISSANATILAQDIVKIQKSIATNKNEKALDKIRNLHDKLRKGNVEGQEANLDSTKNKYESIIAKIYKLKEKSGSLVNRLSFGLFGKQPKLEFTEDEYEYFLAHISDFGDKNDWKSLLSSDFQYSIQGKAENLPNFYQALCYIDDIIYGPRQTNWTELAKTAQGYLDKGWEIEWLEKAFKGVLDSDSIAKDVKEHVAEQEALLQADKEKISSPFNSKKAILTGAALSISAIASSSSKREERDNSLGVVDSTAILKTGENNLEQQTESWKNLTAIQSEKHYVPSDSDSKDNLSKSSKILDSWTGDPGKVSYGLNDSNYINLDQEVKVGDADQVSYDGIEHDDRKETIVETQDNIEVAKPLPSLLSQDIAVNQSFGGKEVVATAGSDVGTAFNVDEIIAVLSKPENEISVPSYMRANLEAPILNMWPSNSGNIADSVVVYTPDNFVASSALIVGEASSDLDLLPKLEFQTIEVNGLKVNFAELLVTAADNSVNCYQIYAIEEQGVFLSDGKSFYALEGGNQSLIANDANVSSDSAGSAILLGGYRFQELSHTDLLLLASSLSAVDHNLVLDGKVSFAASNIASPALITGFDNLSQIENLNDSLSRVVTQPSRLDEDVADISVSQNIITLESSPKIRYIATSDLVVAGDSVLVNTGSYAGPVALGAFAAVESQGSLVSSKEEIVLSDSFISSFSFGDDLKGVSTRIIISGRAFDFVLSEGGTALLFQGSNFYVLQEGLDYPKDSTLQLADAGSLSISGNVLTKSADISEILPDLVIDSQILYSIYQQLGNYLAVNSLGVVRNQGHNIVEILEIEPLVLSQPLSQELSLDYEAAEYVQSRDMSFKDKNVIEEGYESDPEYESDFEDEEIEEEFDVEQELDDDLLREEEQEYADDFEDEEVDQEQKAEYERKEDKSLENEVEQPSKGHNVSLDIAINSPVSVSGVVATAGNDVGGVFNLDEIIAVLSKSENKIRVPSYMRANLEAPILNMWPSDSGNIADSVVVYTPDNFVASSALIVGEASSDLDLLPKLEFQTIEVNGLKVNFAELLVTAADDSVNCYQIYAIEEQGVFISDGKSFYALENGNQSLIANDANVSSDALGSAILLGGYRFQELSYTDLLLLASSLSAVDQNLALEGNVSFAVSNIVSPALITGLDTSSQIEILNDSLSRVVTQPSRSAIVDLTAAAAVSQNTYSVDITPQIRFIPARGVEIKQDLIHVNTGSYAGEVSLPEFGMADQLDDYVAYGKDISLLDSSISHFSFGEDFRGVSTCIIISGHPVHFVLSEGGTALLVQGSNFYVLQEGLDYPKDSTLQLADAGSLSISGNVLTKSADISEILPDLVIDSQILYSIYQQLGNYLAVDNLGVAGKQKSQEIGFSQAEILEIEPASISQSFSEELSLSIKKDPIVSGICPAKQEAASQLFSTLAREDLQIGRMIGLYHAEFVDALAYNDIIAEEPLEKENNPLWDAIAAMLIFSAGYNFAKSEQESHVTEEKSKVEPSLDEFLEQLDLPVSTVEQGSLTDDLADDWIDEGSENKLKEEQSARSMAEAFAFSFGFGMVLFADMFKQQQQVPQNTKREDRKLRMDQVPVFNFNRDSEDLSREGSLDFSDDDSTKSEDFPLGQGGSSVNKDIGISTNDLESINNDIPKEDVSDDESSNLSQYQNTEVSNDDLDDSSQDTATSTDDLGGKNQDVGTSTDDLGDKNQDVGTSTDDLGDNSEEASVESSATTISNNSSTESEEDQSLSDVSKPEEGNSVAKGDSDFLRRLLEDYERDKAKKQRKSEIEKILKERREDKDDEGKNRDSSKPERAKTSMGLLATLTVGAAFLAALVSGAGLIAGISLLAGAFLLQGKNEHKYGQEKAKYKNDAIDYKHLNKISSHASRVDASRNGSDNNIGRS